MERSRAGILEGARAAIVRDGVRRISMVSVAELGSVAKATVYNHVRSKQQLLAMVAQDVVERVAASAEGCDTLAEALVVAARTASDDEVVHAVVTREPAVAGRLVHLLPDPLWQPARQRLATLAATHGRSLDGPALDLVLRWLVTAAVAPTDVSTAKAQVEQLLR
jgi:AcrR family transcriptional regulator